MPEVNALPGGPVVATASKRGRKSKLYGFSVPRINIVMSMKLLTKKKVTVVGA